MSGFSLDMLSSYQSLQGYGMTQGRGPKPPQMTEEMKQEMFTKMDSDGNGTLSKDEIAVSGPASKLEEDTLNALFDTADSDGDGLLSFDETDTFMQSAMKQDMFNRMDSDGDGVLSKTEIASNGPASQLDEETLNSIFDAADSDGDGVISFDESESLHEGMRKAMEDSKASGINGLDSSAFQSLLSIVSGSNSSSSSSDIQSLLSIISGSSSSDEDSIVSILQELAANGVDTTGSLVNTLS